MESHVQALAPDLFHVRLPSGNSHLLNAYLWRSSDGITVVDTGWPGWGPHIEAALHQIDADRGDVARIILTHFHADHVGSAAEIASWSDSEMLAGPVDADIVRNGHPGPPPRLTEAELAMAPTTPGDETPPAACPVDREIRDGDLLGINSEITVLLTPGHTDGSIALHWPHLAWLVHRSHTDVRTIEPPPPRPSFRPVRLHVPQPRGQRRVPNRCRRPIAGVWLFIRSVRDVPAWMLQVEVVDGLFRVAVVAAPSRIRAVPRTATTVKGSSSRPTPAIVATIGAT